jgi:hypothetical protein
LGGERKRGKEKEETEAQEINYYVRGKVHNGGNP